MDPKNRYNTDERQMHGRKRPQFEREDEGSELLAIQRELKRAKDELSACKLELENERMLRITIEEQRNQFEEELKTISEEEPYLFTFLHPDILSIYTVKDGEVPKIYAVESFEMFLDEMWKCDESEKFAYVWEQTHEGTILCPTPSIRNVIRAALEIALFLASKGLSRKDLGSTSNYVFLDTDKLVVKVRGFEYCTLGANLKSDLRGVASLIKK